MRAMALCEVVLNIQVLAMVLATLINLQQLVNGLLLEGLILLW